MPEVTSAYVDRETRRRLRRSDLRTGEELRRLRIDAGITLAELGRVVGIDPSHLSRVERGMVRASIDLLTRVAVALGADLSLRIFPGSGPRLHDRFQAPMVDALIRSLDPRWRVRVEVPITAPARGIVDLVLDDRSTPVTVAGECCSDVRRLEQLIRWSHEKAVGLAELLGRGDELRVVSDMLVVRSTAHNREVAARYAATLAAAYPARTHDVVRALTSSDAVWPGAGIVWMQLDRGKAGLMSYPPRGVRCGR